VAAPRGHHHWMDTPAALRHAGALSRLRVRGRQPGEELLARVAAERRGGAGAAARREREHAGVAVQLPVVAFPDRAAWRAWLLEEHAHSPGVWLAIARNDSGKPTVSYADAVLEALCVGWVDGQKAKGDELAWHQRFGPRRRRSVWSQVNREHIGRLRAAGLMHPAGEREVERAQADDRWDAAYAPQSTATVPPDLQAALDADPAAAAAFARLRSAERYAVLYRLQDAKRPETRARRLAAFLAALAAGEADTLWRRRRPG